MWREEKVTKGKEGIRKKKEPQDYWGEVKSRSNNILQIRKQSMQLIK